jgi:hypothetical protein
MQNDYCPIPSACRGALARDVSSDLLPAGHSWDQPASSIRRDETARSRDQTRRDETRRRALNSPPREVMEDDYCPIQKACRGALGRGRGGTLELTRRSRHIEQAQQFAQTRRDPQQPAETHRDQQRAADRPGQSAHANALHLPQRKSDKRSEPSSSFRSVQPGALDDKQPGSATSSECVLRGPLRRVMSSVRRGHHAA